ncbi:MAG: aspartyl-tRNA(Asn)/glutamyl-tRNA(Gln) amidotransferase subunit A, partial [Halopseudomonas sp.]
MSNEILRMTAVELLQQYRDKTLSPVEVAEAMLVQIERLDSHTNGFCLVDRETSLGLARESEQRYQKGEAQGLVDGVPVAVKDVFLTPMWPTIKGSYTVDPKSTLNKSAPATAALARHGYVPIGKTTTPEFGWKGVTDNPVDGVTNNPWNPKKTAGGSSGGSGVAVALGMAPL